MALSYTDEGPMAEAIVSYSQSGAPKSPHFVDQTVLYRDKAWRPVLYKREVIEASIIRRQRVQSQ
jgi:acyl-homoserine-lactone acylase